MPNQHSCPNCTGIDRYPQCHVISASFRSPGWPALWFFCDWEAGNAVCRRGHWTGAV